MGHPVWGNYTNPPEASEECSKEGHLPTGGAIMTGGDVVPLQIQCDCGLYTWHPTRV